MLLHLSIEQITNQQHIRQHGRNSRYAQRLLPVILHRVAEIRPGEGVLIARPIAGHIGKTCLDGAGDQDAGNQCQREHLQNAASLHLRGFARGVTILIHRRVIHQHHHRAIGGLILYAHQIAGRKDGVKQHGNHHHRGDPGDTGHQVDTAQSGQADAQHFPEKLPPVLGQILLAVIALSALAIVKAVH